MVNAAISGFAEVVRGSICPEQLDCCSILQILERRMWFLKLGRGQRARQVRQVTRKEALQYRYESPQHFWIWGWLDVNGRLTSMAGPSSCNFDAFGGGVPRKAWLRFASIKMSLTMTRRIPVDHRNDSVYSTFRAVNSMTINQQNVSNRTDFVEAP